MANLLISQLNKKQITSFKAPQNQVGRGFDDSVIYAQNNLHAAPAKGKLVKSSIFSAPYIFVKDTAEDVVSLKDAIISGNSNDYKLGRINDLSLKLGSLAIAAYLFTKKNTASKKFMELIGFGAFFGSMALWPKLFIQLPAKLLHGVDVFQEYEDSQGRKKRFFLDPQYTPWDIISPEEMSKLGDRLNIPRDIKNRSDLTKEKAHKIALQSNTLWMLSAGFGVPIMSSFICSGIEKFLPAALSNTNQKLSDVKLGRLLKNIKNGVENVKPDSNTIKTFNDFIKDKENAPITKDFITALANVISDDKLHTKEIENILRNSGLFSSAIDSNENLINIIFEKFAKDFEASGITREKFNAEFAKLNVSDSTSSLANSIKIALKNSITKGRKHRGFDFIDSEIKDGISSNTTSASFTLEAKDFAGKLNQLFARLKTATRTIHENLSLKSANSEEAVATRLWLQFSSKFTDMLNLSGKDISEITNSDKATYDAILNSLTNLSKDQNAYNKQFSSLISIYSNFIKNADLYILKNNEIQIGNNQFVNYIAGLEKESKQIETIFSAFANAFENNDAGSFAKTLRKIQNNILSQNINLANMSKISSFSRAFLTMDFAKRMNDDVLITQIKEIAKNLGSTSIDDAAASKILKEAENVLFSGELTDYITKFNTAGDSGFNFKVITKLLFDENYLSENTKQLFKMSEQTASIETSMFKNFLENMYNFVANSYNAHFPKIWTSATDTRNYSERAQQVLKAKTAQAMTGTNIITMIKKNCNELFNTRIWTKKFATLGIAVAAITVASQFLFGRLKNDINVVPQESEAA